MLRAHLVVQTSVAEARRWIMIGVDAAAHMAAALCQQFARCHMAVQVVFSVKEAHLYDYAYAAPVQSSMDMTAGLNAELLSAPPMLSCCAGGTGRHYSRSLCTGVADIVVEQTVRSRESCNCRHCHVNTRTCAG